MSEDNAKFQIFLSLLNGTVSNHNLRISDWNDLTMNQEIGRLIDETEEIYNQLENKKFYWVSNDY